jgi:ATP-dependent RNA helicase DeaD
MTTDSNAPSAQEPQQPADQAPGSSTSPDAMIDAVGDAAGDDSRPVHAPHGKGEIFDETSTFESLGLRNSVLKGCAECGFSRPTKTQAMLIPAIMSGRDILGQAKTGTGKTAAFALPLLHGLDKDKPFQALILAPTRELAIQITAEIEDLGRFTPIKSVCLFGGQAVRTQATKLQRGGNQIVVGTPGRVMDMLERGLIHFDNVRFAILDEVDRMLDIGFRDDIRKILERIKHAHQTVFVSATISPDIERLARKFMRDPEKVVVASGSLTVSLVEQHYLTVNQWDKRRLLVHLLKHEEPALTVIFCRLKRVVDELTTLLNKHGIDAYAIHGDMPQGKRNQVMQRLRTGDLSVLVASDLASRGIDVDDVSHVINYDLPEDPEVYVHRIGRTARAGRKGIAWALVTPDQGELLTSIELLINKEIPKMEYPDFQSSDPPPGWRNPDERQAGGLRLANAPEAPEAAPKAPAITRAAAVANLAVPPADAKLDASKFPGGVVPTKLPPKRLFGKMPTRGR